jgi:hypothetical protein
LVFSDLGSEVCSQREKKKRETMAAMVCTGAAERAKPSAADIERALAGFRGFVEEGDDSSMYLEPLREFLMAEGDIAGELEMTEEHLKKLKFNFTESFTKRLFVEAVNNGQIDESAEQSAELGALLFPLASPADLRSFITGLLARRHQDRQREEAIQNRPATKGRGCTKHCFELCACGC